VSADQPFSVHRDVEAAAARLQGQLVTTPLVPSPWLSWRRGADVRLKLENVQVTGSFKARGALNRLSQLSPTERRRGVVAASSGNHGLGVAHAARRLGVEATVFVPTTTPESKRQLIALAGAAVAVHGDDCVVTESHARQLAAATERVYVSPYNDPGVIAGQGTVAVELLKQWPEVEIVYVAAGGGGLLSGMAGWARGHGARCEWVGCSPSASPALAECVRQGAVVDVPCSPTWSDSTHGGVEPDAITVPLCRELVDRWITVGEQAIAQAMRGCLQHQHLLVEGAAGVAIASLLADPSLGGRRACVVVCGGNLPWERLRVLVGGG
jgi:threonine dehydratase